MRIQTFTSSKWVGVFSTSCGAEFTARIHYTFRYFNIQCPNNCKGSNVKSNLCRDRVQNNWNLAIKLIYTMKILKKFNGIYHKRKTKKTSAYKIRCSTN